MLGKKMWGNEYRAITVCIDRYENRVPKGRIYHLTLPEGMTFYGLMDFFQTTEELLNEMRFPQPFDAVRSFRQGAEPKEEEIEAPVGEIPKVGKLGSFVVRVIFRQNASWQGSVSWLEGKREESFRSALELVLLMDSALSGEADPSQV